MVFDGDRLPAPHATGILKVADQFLLLGIHADNRQALTHKTSLLPRDALKLPVALRVRTGETLGVGVQGITQLSQQPPHRSGADGDAPLLQLAGDLRQPFAGPQTTPTGGIARRILLEQAGQGLQQTGSFFSARGRPPPG
jgi:hypothetical protein